jgi:hypothetical protein
MPSVVILLAFLLVILIPVAVRLTMRLYRRRRLAAELRRDWWPVFEQEFRAYASRAWASAREAERGP